MHRRKILTEDSDGEVDITIIETPDESDVDENNIEDESDVVIHDSDSDSDSDSEHSEPDTECESCTSYYRVAMSILFVTMGLTGSLLMFVSSMI